MHERLGAFRDVTPGLKLIHEGMTLYLREQPEGKMFHDPLAACVAYDPEIAVFEEVELYQTHGEWGARRATGTGTFITVAVDHERFFRTLACSEHSRAQ
jgi:pyrimidine-specific ribonucleoside hydrolase